MILYYIIWYYIILYDIILYYSILYYIYTAILTHINTYDPLLIPYFPQVSSLQDLLRRHWAALAPQLGFEAKDLRVGRHRTRGMGMGKISMGKSMVGKSMGNPQIYPNLCVLVGEFTYLWESTRREEENIKHHLSKIDGKILEYNPICGDVMGI